MEEALIEPWPYDHEEYHMDLSISLLNLSVDYVPWSPLFSDRRHFVRGYAVKIKESRVLKALPICIKARKVLGLSNR